MKNIQVEMDWTEAGAKVTAYGFPINCPRCGVLVNNQEHACGDRLSARKPVARKPRAPKKAAKGEK